MIPQWESAPAVCRPGLCRNNPGSPTPAPFQAVRGIPARTRLQVMPGRSGETSPNKKAMGLLRSMALIGLGIYGVAMRVNAGSSC